MSASSVLRRRTKSARDRVWSASLPARRRWRNRHPTTVQRAIRAADRVRALRYRIHRPPASHPLARIMQAFSRAVPDATFVQIGAHDGTQLDPLRESMLATRWTGVLVEPVPFVFERLRQRYGHKDRFHLENVAIGLTDTVMPFHYIPEVDDEVWPWYDALGSFRREVLLSHTEFIPDIEARIRTIDVPCISFETLCDRHDLRTIDVLQMDTEGYDLTLLETIDLDAHEPALVMFEHLHLTTDERIRARELLFARGYVVVADGMDAIGLSTAALRHPGVARAHEHAAATLQKFRW